MIFKIAALASICINVLGSPQQHLGDSSYQTHFVYIGFICALLAIAGRYMFLLSKRDQKLVKTIGRLRSKIKRLSKQSQGVDEQQIQRNGFNLIEDISIVVIDEFGFVESVNEAFSDIAEAGDVIDQVWDEYLLKNFKRESLFTGKGYIYKSKADLFNDYLIRSNMDKNTGRRICTITKIDAKALHQVGKARVKTLEENKFNAYDFLELKVSQKNAEVGTKVFELQDIQYADDAYIYTADSDAKRVLSTIVSGLNIVFQSRKICESIVINIRRQKNVFRFEAIVENINLSSEDFSKNVSWNGQECCIADILREIELDSKNLFGATTVVKNINNSNSKSVSFVVEINDYAKLKWFSQEHRI